MKELSVEEKAKAYEEKIDMARNIYADPSVKDEDKYYIEVIFPELCESEDEKIRKELIEYIKDQQYSFISAPDCRDKYEEEDNDRYNSWIAWLEKQAERKTPRWMIDFLDNYRRMIGCSLDYDEARDVDGKILCIKEWLEKQGETSPILSNSLDIGKDAWSEEEQNRFAKVVLTSCAMSFIDYLDAHKYEGKMCVSNGECEDIENAFHNAMWDRLHRYYCKYIEKQGEQKPAWSEEDDYNLQCCIAKVQYDIDNGRIGRNRELLTWLKSLKDRVQPQPKQEWSEEDIVAIDCAVDVLNKDLPTLAASIKRLKSLRPQNRWKPSDEQMKILNEVLNFAANHESPHWNDYIFGTLNNLMRQLKKLREE